jgi:hypothetical protein
VWVFQWRRQVGRPLPTERNPTILSQKGEAKMIVLCFVLYFFYRISGRKLALYLETSEPIYVNSPWLLQTGFWVFLYATVATVLGVLYFGISLGLEEKSKPRGGVP